MLESNVVPVTNQENLNNRISNSVKISKQVAKNQLKKALDDKKKEYDASKTSMSVLFEAAASLIRTEVEKKVRMDISHDGDITRLRKLMHRFSNFEFEKDEKTREERRVHPDTNLGVIRQIHTAGILATITNAKMYDSTTSKETIEKFYKDHEVEVDVDFIYEDLNDDEHNGYGDTIYMGATYTVALSKEVVELVKKYGDEIENSTVLNNEYNVLDKKLQEIDDLTEEMEAQLLVRELNQSSEGREALGIASELLTNILGETPVLIGSTGEKEDG